MPESASLENSVEKWLSEPLEDFYRMAGLPLPAIRQISPNETPQPYRTLLVHQSDMTSTLERFHHGSIRIRALSSKRRGDFYYREVLLYVEGHERVVEFGAIRIDFSLLPEPACAAILDEHLPLGHILNLYGIDFASRPKAYLKIWSDDLMNTNLRLSAPQWLYGRRNSLLVPSGGTLAEIVEILPP
jgi:chorismate-pyruvate lyase